MVFFPFLTLAFAATSTTTLTTTTSEHTAKFERMVSDLSLPSTTIQFVDSSKERLLFRALSIAASDPVIRNAFAIIYEDLGPIRAAGDIIFSQLSEVAVGASERAAAAGNIDALASLAASRNLFYLVDGDSSGSLSRAELLAWPQLLDLVKEDGEGYLAAVDRFMDIMDVDDNGEIGFVEFVNAVATEPRLQVATEVADADIAASAALEKSRRLFDRLDDDGSGELDRNELLASPELLSFIREGDEGDEVAVARFMSTVDKDKNGSISFSEFALAASEQPVLQLVDDALNVAMLNQLKRIEASNAAFLSSTTGSFLSGRSRRKKRHAFRFRKSPEDRFDSMLAECLVWEQQLYCAPSVDPTTGDTIESEEECIIDDPEASITTASADNGRLLQVLKGSFAGVHCAPVSQALRVCYLECSPLRIGGDLVFKLMRRLVATQVSK